jgi:hypothetical protein
MKKYSSYPNALRSVYFGIVQRCDNNNSYDCYGKNNVALSKEWKENPVLFFDWALENKWEPGKHIHRKDKSGGYCTNNCEILTSTEHYLKHHPKNVNNPHKRKNKKSYRLILTSEELINKCRMKHSAFGDI